MMQVQFNISISLEMSRHFNTNGEDIFLTWSSTMSQNVGTTTFSAQRSRSACKKLDLHNERMKMTGNQHTNLIKHVAEDTINKEILDKPFLSPGFLVFSLHKTRMLMCMRMNTYLLLTSSKVAALENNRWCFSRGMTTVLVGDVTDDDVCVMFDMKNATRI